MLIEERINQEIEKNSKNIDPSLADVELLTTAIKIVIDAVNDVIPKYFINPMCWNILIWMH